MEAIHLFVIIKKGTGMRNAMVQLCLVIIGVTSIHAVRLLETSSFHVRIFPAEGAGKVLAIQGRDSLEMTNVDGEYYLRSINSGHWQINVESAMPYKSIQYKITVKPGADTDLGEIRLTQ
jgi:hypothetical protein